MGVTHEPIGGIDGLTLVQAKPYVKLGHSAKRAGQWPHATAVTFDETSELFMLDGTEYIPHPADEVSCDWYIIEKDE